MEVRALEVHWGDYTEHEHFLAYLASTDTTAGSS
jgi:hypothetical protein